MGHFVYYNRTLTFVLEPGRAIEGYVWYTSVIMSSKGNYRKLPNGLTPRENAFKDNMLEQIATNGQPNGTKAALETYDTKDRKIAGAIASENLNKPEIRNAIEQALSSNGVTEDGIIKNIKGLAEFSPHKISGETVLKANLSILKIMGHDSNGKNTKGKVTVNNTIINIGYDEAKDKLQKMNSDVDTFIQDADIL
jgi:hypothetical protein